MIQFHHLSVGYKGRAVLRDIDIMIPKGKITALIGPNGCGKTTLLKTAGGLLPPLEGEVEIDGKPAGKYRTKELARLVVMLPQGRETPAITVERLVAQGRYPHLGGLGWRLSPKDRQLVQAAIDDTGCADLAGRELKTLSGGERQRAYIAMALAQDTPLLLLDEPTTYLDIGQKLEVMGLLRQLNRRGKTILAVLHDLDLAFGCCDYVGLVDQGGLLAFGPAFQVFAQGLPAKSFGVKSSKVEAGGKSHFLFY